jgi:hypothetical protein
LSETLGADADVANIGRALSLARLPIGAALARSSVENDHARAR